MWRDRTNLRNRASRSRNAYSSSPLPDHFPGTSSDSNTRSSPSKFKSKTGLPEDRQGLLSDPFDDHDDGDDLSGDGDAVIEMDLLPPRWAEVSDEITETLATIAQKIQALDHLHQKHVVPGFNDEDRKRREEVEIEKMTTDITVLFHQSHGRIDRIQNMVEEARATGSLSPAEETLARNLRISLATRVQTTSTMFRKKQSVYLKKLRDMNGMGASSPFDSAPSSVMDPSWTDSDADRHFSESTLEQQQQQLHRPLNNTIEGDATIQRREHEIAQIANSIIQLSDLFRDLQTMVIDQGTVLDRIDYNVENVLTHVQRAEKELVVATGYHRKSTKRKVIFLLLLLILGMIILVVLKPKS